jgi:hypothetical protein
VPPSALPVPSIFGFLSVTAAIPFFIHITLKKNTPRDALLLGLSGSKQPHTAKDLGKNYAYLFSKSLPPIKALGIFTAS